MCTQYLTNHVAIKMYVKKINPAFLLPEQSLPIEIQSYFESCLGIF